MHNKGANDDEEPAVLVFFFKLRTNRVKWSTMDPTSSPTRSWLGHSSPRCRHSRMSSWDDECSATSWSTPLVTLSPVNYRGRDAKTRVGEEPRQ